MIFTNETRKGRNFKSEFISRIKNARSLTIATGYFGASLIQEIESKLVKISRNGNCRLLLGMIFHSGISKKQKDAIESLDKKLRAESQENGIYISRKEYHGKIYKIDNNIYLGSSNLSEHGFISRWECTAQINDLATQNETSEYLDFLFNEKTTVMLSEVDLTTPTPTKTLKPSRFLKDYEVKTFPSGKIIDSINIELRVDKQPASSLNLYFDKGRKNTKGLYAPRPWYEVEITTSSAERLHPCYPKSKKISDKKKSRYGEFNAYIQENGKIYKLRMTVASDKGKAIASSTESGGRETLGRYIKGKLETAGILKYGERITSEILDVYGRNFITLKKINDKNYILEF